MTSKKTALIFTHARHEGPALLRSILEEKNFSIEIVPTPEKNVSAMDALAPGVVIVMGGPMGVYEADRYPFIAQEIEFLQKRLAADLPTLGICLGAQLMAAALGCAVFKGQQGQEIGWSPLSLMDNVQDHPVRHLCGQKTNMLHWHGDTFDLPAGAVLLASSALYKNQAYSYGSRALALQCHPEVVPAQLEQWLDLSAHEVEHSVIADDAEHVRRQAGEFIAQMNNQTRLFFSEWLLKTGLA